MHRKQRVVLAVMALFLQARTVASLVQKDFPHLTKVDLQGLVAQTGDLGKIHTWYTTTRPARSLCCK